jgi:hypothetical protein
MARTIASNELLVDKIKDAREAEREAVRQAKIKYEALIQGETSVAHDDVLEAVREAVFAGMSVRQIGFAYGSSDPHTAKRIVAEAMAGYDVDSGNPNAASGWKITLPENDNSLFTLKVYSFGDNKQDGEVVASVDEDEINITAQDGDYWVVSQLYRQGMVESVLKDYWKARNKRDGI